MKKLAKTFRKTAIMWEYKRILHDPRGKKKERKLFPYFRHFSQALLTNWPNGNLSSFMHTKYYTGTRRRIIRASNLNFFFLSNKWDQAQKKGLHMVGKCLMTSWHFMKPENLTIFVNSQLLLMGKMKEISLKRLQWQTQILKSNYVCRILLCSFAF